MVDRIDEEIINIEKMQKYLERAIIKLNKAPQEDREFIEDSIVARYNILIELLWRLLATHLEKQGIKFIDSTRGTLKKALEINFLTTKEYEAFRKFLRKRHTGCPLYDEWEDFMWEYEKIDYQPLIILAPTMLSFSKDILNKIKQ